MEKRRNVGCLRAWQWGSVGALVGGLGSGAWTLITNGTPVGVWVELLGCKVTLGLAVLGPLLGAVVVGVICCRPDVVGGLLGGLLGLATFLGGRVIGALVFGERIGAVFGVFIACLGMPLLAEAFVGPIER